MIMDMKKVQKMFAEIVNYSEASTTCFDTHLEEIIKRNLQLEIINQITKSISIEMSFEEMMEDVAKKLQYLISYDLLNLCLLEEEELIVKTAMPKNTLVLVAGTSLPPEGCWSWEVVKSKNFSIKTDIQHDAGVFAPGLQEFGIKSFIIVPVVARGGVLGTLNLGSREHEAYNVGDARFLQQVADQLGLIIENARLYQEEALLRAKWENSYKMASSLMKETEKRNTQLEIINQIAKSITVEMTPWEILANIQEKLKKVISYDNLSILLLDEGKLIIKASFPKNYPLFEEEAAFKIEETALGKAIKEKKTISRSDIKSQQEYREDISYLQQGIAAVVTVPLVVKGKAVGALNLSSRQTYAFIEEDILFLQQVADQLALCLENTRLYLEETRAKQEWVATFNATTDMLIVVDKDYKVLRFNKILEQFQTQGENLKPGDACYCYFNSQKTECPDCPARRVLETGRPAGRRFHLDSGIVIDVGSFPIYDEHGKVREVVNAVRDVTEEVNMEAQLVQSAKLAAIGELAAGVAHELNSPLTAVIGDALILLRGNELLPAEKRRVILEDIRKCGERCKNIVQNLSAFARQEQYAFETLCLNDVLEAALSLVVYQIEKGCIRIIKDFQDDLPLIVGSIQHLEQVVINFLINARDSLENKSERVIAIRSGRRGRFVYVTVEDNGEGIKKDRLSQIFMPFYTTKKKGTGLGLSICKNIAENHDGIIEVESQEEKGSSFSLLIPFEENNE